VLRDFCFSLFKEISPSPWISISIFIFSSFHFHKRGSQNNEHTTHDEHFNTVKTLVIKSPLLFLENKTNIDRLVAPTFLCQYDTGSMVRFSNYNQRNSVCSVVTGSIVPPWSRYGACSGIISPGSADSLVRREKNCPVMLSSAVPENELDLDVNNNQKFSPNATTSIFKLSAIMGQDQEVRYLY
jgi:hypothetical protein